VVSEGYESVCLKITKCTRKIAPKMNELGVETRYVINLHILNALFEHRLLGTPVAGSTGVTDEYHKAHQRFLAHSARKVAILSMSILKIILTPIFRMRPDCWCEVLDPECV
jgi:hypothetical protein